MDKLYLLVAGSRSFADEGYIWVGNQQVPCEDAVGALISGRCNAIEHDGVCVVEGGARGVDQVAGNVARSMGFDVHVMKADWSKGRSAGYARNRDMNKYISQFPKREVLLIWDGESRGTVHNFRLAHEFHNPIVCYLYKQQRFMNHEEIMTFI